METESKVYSFQMMKYWDQESLPKTRTPQRAIFLKEEQNRGEKKITHQQREETKNFACPSLDSVREKISLKNL